MQILKDYTDAQILEIAAQPTPQMSGTWMLTRPDGVSFAGTSPFECVKAETDDRIPPLVALARIRRSLIEEPVSDAENEAYAEGRDDERKDNIRLLAWAYRKLMHTSFSKQEDALAMDEIKLMMEGAR